MKPNIEAIQNLINNNFGGNRSKFAKAIGVDRTQVSIVLNTGAGAGALFIGGLLAYCKKNNLEFEDYFFYPEREKS
jgi:hypothetical protein